MVPENLPSIIGGKAFICGLLVDDSSSQWDTELTPGANKGTDLSNGSRCAVELSSDCGWTALSCQQAKIISWTELSKAQEDAVYHLYIFVSTRAIMTVL
jgi:hypothetical protein